MLFTSETKHFIITDSCHQMYQVKYNSYFNQWHKYLFKGMYLQIMSQMVDWMKLNEFNEDIKWIIHLISFGFTVQHSIGLVKKLRWFCFINQKMSLWHQMYHYNLAEFSKSNVVLPDILSAIFSNSARHQKSLADNFLKN